MAISRRLERLGSGAFSRLDRLKALYNLNKDLSRNFPLIDLSLGSTDLLPQPVVLEAVSNALRDPLSSMYSLQSSTKPFREAAAGWINSRFGIKVDPEKEVLLLIGSQEATAHLPMALINPGQIGLILDPCYPSHEAGLILADAEIKRILLRSEENWRPDFRGLSNSELDQAQMILLGFPHNPTAQVGDQKLLDEIMDLGVRHQMVVVHDNP